MSLPTGYKARARRRGLSRPWFGRFFRSGYFCLTLVIMLITLKVASSAAEMPVAGTSILQLKQLSLEELMGVEVTSVSKKEERLFEAAAAIYVMTQEDIRRSGATSIPEALRYVPGLEVVRLNANTWQISARGFVTTANKLLVLIDGRSVYTPLVAGVFWDVQDTLLEDVDRIEVIRGPGGTLWGANAVNGVINIITKSARDTQGWLVTGGGGTAALAGYGTAASWEKPRATGSTPSTSTAMTWYCSTVPMPLMHGR